MNKELKLEEKEMTRRMSIDMISAYRMSVRQAEGDKDKVRSQSATKAVNDEIDNIMGQDVFDPVRFDTCR